MACHYDSCYCAPLLLQLPSLLPLARGFTLYPSRHIHTEFSVLFHYLLPAVLCPGIGQSRAKMAINYGQGSPERPSRGAKLFITATVMVGIAALFVLARLAVRWKSRMFGMDDYTIAAALVCFSSARIDFSSLVVFNWW